MKQTRFLGTILLMAMIAFVITFVSCKNGLTNDSETQSALTGRIGVSVPHVDTLKEGNTITVVTTNLGGSGTFSFFWYRGSDRIIGATGSSYTLISDDVGKLITVEVSRSGNTGFVSYNLPNPVLPSTAPDLSGSITIDGISSVGQFLTANTSNLNGTGEIRYQWFREGAGVLTWSHTDIYSTFHLTSAVVGQRIQLRVYRMGYYGVIQSAFTSAVTW